MKEKLKKDIKMKEKSSIKAINRKSIVTSINFAIARIFISVIIVIVMIFTSGASALLNDKNGLGFFDIDDDITGEILI